VKPEEARLKEDDAEIGFFEEEGLFLADVLREQVLLALPMKAICRSDCRGFVPKIAARTSTTKSAAVRLTRRTPFGSTRAPQAGLAEKQ